MILINIIKDEGMSEYYNKQKKNKKIKIKEK